MVWQNNTGALTSGTRFIRYGLPGSSDILGLTPNGRFIACECKVKRDTVKPLQEAFGNCIQARGGLFAVVRWTEKNGITGLADLIEGATKCHSITTGSHHAE
jgi:hypothetical protein